MLTFTSNNGPHRGAAACPHAPAAISVAPSFPRDAASERVIATSFARRAAPTDAWAVAVMTRIDDDRTRPSARRASIDPGICYARMQSVEHGAGRV